MNQQARCSARLLRDLKEVLQQPLPDVNALPCNDDLLVWHGNVRGQDAVLGGSLVHFVMVFPSDYPQKAPGVWLYTPVPHPNIVSHLLPTFGVTGARWKLKMWDCIPGQDSWSSAYTVHSILLQLQVFLLDEDLQWDTSKVTREAAIHLASELVVPACGHRPGHPFPPLPTAADLAQAASAQGKVVVTRPKLKPRAATGLALAAAGVACKPSAAAAPGPAFQRPGTPSGVAHACPALLPNTGKGSSQAAPHTSTVGEPAEAAQPSNPGAAASDGWVEVRHKGSKRKLSELPGKASGSAPGASGTSSGTSSSSNTFQALQDLDAAAEASSMGYGGEAAAAPTVGAAPAEGGSSNGTAADGEGTAPAMAAPLKGPKRNIPGGVLILSKAAKRNAARSANRANKTADKSSLASAASTASSSSGIPTAGASLVAAAPPSASHPSGAAVSTASSSSDWTPVKSNTSPSEASKAGSNSGGVAPAEAASKTHAELIQDAYRDHADTLQAAQAGSLHVATVGAGDKSHGSVLEAPPASMGPLMDQLPPDTLSGIMCLLGAGDLACLGSTCRGLKQAVDDGLVWRSMLLREFPQSQLKASSAADWKHTYLMQASAVMGDLQCFFTKHSMAEACLGLPLRYSMNPKTQQLDYIEAGLDLVSLDAVHSGWVVESPDGQEIQACLPVYLSFEHFERVKVGRGLQKALRALAPEQMGTGGAPPAPSAWLQIMPKLLNTAIVLLMDKGVAASERALITYCGLHRLFLALAEDFNLFPQAAARIDRFVKSPASRVKAQTPNMGWFIPLLTLGTHPDHNWKGMASMIVEEGLDRSIIWMCKQHPNLQESLGRDPASGDSDPELLKLSFAACSVGLRLIAFHVAFLTLIARPQGSSLQQVMEAYDALYGRPGPALQQKMRQVTQKILAMDSWATYLRMVGLPVAGHVGVFMTRRLRLAWRNSLQKGYHSKGMDFSRIQASGVSKLLLKGQQYSAPPNMNRIHVLDKWRFAGYTPFLDATMFLLAKGGRIIDTVDFSHTRSIGTSVVGAVSHSGDMMDESSSTHTIDVQLSNLGANVASLVLVLSAYSWAMLDAMRQPFVMVEDPATKMPLCEYHLENHSKEVLAAHKAVVMCRIFRGPTGVWQVEALGKMLPSGSASNYRPIKLWLAEQGW